MPVVRLKTISANAVRFTWIVAPMEAMPAFTVVPIAAPMASAADCSKFRAPAASAMRLVAMTALHDCIMTVSTMPINITKNRAPNVPEGRIEKSTAEVSPYMPLFSMPMPRKRSPNPASAVPR